MTTVRSIAEAAKKAAQEMKQANTSAKNQALAIAAKLMRANKDKILIANEKDLQEATKLNLTEPQIDRLKLDAKRVEGIAIALEKIAKLPDPVGKTIDEWRVPNGMKISRVRVPLGVIGVIFESRPNVTADAGALCLKSGNACILRGGSESFYSSQAIGNVMTEALQQAGLPKTAVQIIPTRDREAVGEMLRLHDLIDVIIPRGGKSLIARVQEESRIPVLAHLDGNCHVYVHERADLEMAKKIALNAKLRRTGVCGAAESLLIDSGCAKTHLQPLVKMLLDEGCEIRGDDITQSVDARVNPATEEDWGTEYLAPTMSIKVVEDINEAIAHIGKYGSHHTDCIISEDKNAAETFLRAVDSAIVLHNASTQFADGGEFGMGAEIGIATGRLHARGPVGLEQLTTYKNVIHGSGQVRSL